MHLLCAESEYPLAVFLTRRFEAEKHQVDVAADADEAMGLAQQNEYDLFILDLALARSHGPHMLKKLRAVKQHVPILALCNQASIEERVQALDMGADDCLAKPFSFAELAARVRALLRRVRIALKPLVLTVGDLELNRVEHSVQRAGRLIELTPKEFLLLECLMQNAGQPVPRAHILTRVWNFSSDCPTNVVDVYINYLRKKVDEPFESQLIRTIRGVGYQIGGAGPGAVQSRTVREVSVESSQ
jgi:DNA-binding response OmpR family regulator